MEVELVILGALGAAFAWSLGAHYTGACVGMPLAAGALTAQRALLLMAPLAFLGAVVAAPGVEATVGHGLLGGGPVSIGVALGVLLTAVALTTLYNYLTIPTSTIQILVFAAVGTGLATGHPVFLATLAELLVLWVCAPLGALAVSFGVVWVAASRRRPPPSGLSRGLVAGLVAVGAGASFAMGANDVANASGPLIMSGAFSILVAGTIGGAGIAVGVLSWGGRILRAVAFDVVRLDPEMAFASQLGQALTILAGVSLGLFTSMNQALVGAMIGAGYARGRKMVLWPKVRAILVGWAVGPVSALGLAAGVGWTLRAAGWA